MISSIRFYWKILISTNLLLICICLIIKWVAGCIFLQTGDAVRDIIVKRQRIYRGRMRCCRISWEVFEFLLVIIIKSYFTRLTKILTTDTTVVGGWVYIWSLEIFILAIGIIFIENIVIFYLIGGRYLLGYLYSRVIFIYLLRWIVSKIWFWWDLADIPWIRL